MKKILILLSIVFLFGCKENQPTAPVEQAPEATTPAPSPPLSSDAISAIASESAAARVNWKNRGVAPIGYVKGMALAFAKEVCNPNPIVSAVAIGSSDKDVLKYYESQIKEIKAENLSSSMKTYVLLLGLGMRESSGEYCTGRDGSANNIQADTAEGGILQTSYDSRGADPSLAPFFKNYSGKCNLEIFKEGVSCGTSYLKNWGTGADGLAFQKKVKECPSFAVEYAAITTRKLRKHYGPINRMEVEFRKEAVELFTAVEMFVKKNPLICSEL